MPLDTLLKFLSDQIWQTASSPVKGNVPCEWQEWTIFSLGGGRNNHLYHVSKAENNFVVKFSRRDPRDRAGREYQALVLLQELNLMIAPQPILLERERYTFPVVVQSWLAGEMSDSLPGDHAAWMSLLEHYAVIHSVTQANVGTPGPLDRCLCSLLARARSYDETTRF
ncbi:MAG: phosphotransferase [Anaerolineaceae bacterium]|nr:phosphotransferase [Anaerolineaceae bacterium]